MAGRSCSARRSAVAQVLLFMATTASAALTLSDFQSITASSVPLGCILAYNNSPLSGCSQQTDFTAGNGCSATCTRSLRLVQATLQTVCVDAGTSAGSVLGAAMQGSLVEALCGRGVDQSSSGVSTRTSPPVPSSRPTAPSASDAATPTPQEPTSVPSGDGSAARASSTNQGGVVPTGAAPTTTPSPQAPGDQRGGGSPFDAVVIGASDRFSSPPASMALWMATVSWLLLWRINP